MKSPFKFLDSYTKNDREIFFGREREIEELYHRVFESKIMLVYGVSGTGKSSLIHCGLANKFQETDWLPLVIRRGGNILESFGSVIKAASITRQPDDIINPVQFKKSVRSLYLDHYKPVFFIFDQFEELFIFGNKEERKSIIQVIKALVDSEIQCRFIFVMREEYMAGISEFEKVIPTIFSNRVRIEKMSSTNAIEAINGPCRIAGISLEEGFAEALLEKLIQGSSEVELTYLQVFLDRIFHLTVTEKQKQADKSETETAPEKIHFTISRLSQAGNVSDLLGGFLDDQISLMEDPDSCLTVLKTFVSVKGTRKQMNIEEINESIRTLGKLIDIIVLQEILQKFIQLRILRDRDQSGRYELVHDALAGKIFEKITLIEKELLEIRQLIENSWHSWQKRGILLSAEDLLYIAPYESRLYLPEEYKKFITDSKNKLIKTRLRKRNILSGAAVLLIFILCGFTFWALKERGKALAKERIANEATFKATTSEKEAIIARDKAIESDKMAIASKQEAIVARDLAQEAAMRILQEQKITALKEKQARANNFNYFSKELAVQDPTVALRIAEFALTLDPGNRSIINNLNSIYYDNSFYNIFYKGEPGELIRISSDWKRIISAKGRTARIIDVEGKGSKILIGHLLSAFSTFNNHLFSRIGVDDIISMEFSPDGKYVITGSIDRTARLWDTEGNLLKVFRGHSGQVYSVSFSPDSRTVLTGSGDATARLWSIDGQNTLVFKGHKGAVLSVTFSPDGNNILTGSADSTALLWDLKGNAIKSFKGHSDMVWAVAFSPDGKSIFTGSGDKTAKLWDLDGNNLKVFSGHSDIVKSIAVSFDGKFLLTGSADKTARLWDIDGNTLQIFKGHTGPINSTAFSADGMSALTSCSDGLVRKWNLSLNTFRNLTGHQNNVYKAIYSPDGKILLTISGDGTMKFWDLSGICKQTVKIPSNAVAFSPDGLTLLSGAFTPQLLDLNGKPLKTFTGHSGTISSVAFSPDGRTVLTGSTDNSARLWDLRSARTLQVFTGHSAVVYCVSFSPDGKSVLTGSWDKTARLWDLNGNTISVFKGHNGYVTSAVFSPDGSRILTGSTDKSARIWDQNGNQIQSLNGHTDAVTSAAFSPDGKTILTGSGDKSARVWDLSGNTLQVISGFRSPVYSVCYSPDGKTMLLGSGDNIARLINCRQPVEDFLKDNQPEKLSMEQMLKYELIQIDDVKTIKDELKILGVIRYLLSEAKINIDRKAGYLDAAYIMFKRTNSNTSAQKTREMFLSCGLDLLRLRPQQYLSDRIHEADRITLSLTTKDELMESYEYYSQKCYYPDSVTITLGLPETFIEIAKRFLAVDTSARKTISMDLASLSWPLLQYGHFKTSLDALNLALTADTTNEFIYETLPLALLLNNGFDDAKQVYLKYYKRPVLNTLMSSFGLIYLKDIDDLEKRGITHPDFVRVREIIKN